MLGVLLHALCRKDIAVGTQPTVKACDHHGRDTVTVTDIEDNLGQCMILKP